MATKNEAKREADTLRATIRGGAFQDDGPVLDGLITVRQLFDQYFERCITVKRPDTAPNEVMRIAQIMRVDLPLPTSGSRPFGDWAVSDVTTDSVERFREVRLATGGGVVGINRNLQLMGACWNWAIRVGYVERTPFKRGTETVIKLAKELARHRRLQPGEEGPLLVACDELLRAVVEGALETGCRQGELLDLQWVDVSVQRGVITLTALKTKASKDRVIPISSRLRMVLDMRRNAPDGEPHPPEAFVFGNTTGERTSAALIHWAWKTAVLKANGYPGRPKTYGREYRAVDLRFHDLRREAGSRWLEGGVPLHKVRDWLGHSNVAQTSTYLAGVSGGDEDYMRKFDERVGRVRPPTQAGKRSAHLFGRA